MTSVSQWTTGAQGVTRVVLMPVGCEGLLPLLGSTARAHSMSVKAKCRIKITEEPEEKFWLVSN